MTAAGLLAAPARSSASAPDSGPPTAEAAFRLTASLPGRSHPA